MSLVSQSALDACALRRIARLFRWRGVGGDSQWVDEKRLELVRDYLKYYSGDRYWNIITQGGVRGYSLFLHEWVEFSSYRMNGIDPFDREQRRKEYRKMHARGLLAEHRFIQSVTCAEGLSLSLCELVTYNPHGDKPNGTWPGDWGLVSRHLGDKLSFEDHLLHNEADALKFYADFGFQEV